MTIAYNGVYNEYAKNKAVYRQYRRHGSQSAGEQYSLSIAPCYYGAFAFITTIIKPPRCANTRAGNKLPVCTADIRRGDFTITPPEMLQLDQKYCIIFGAAAQAEQKFMLAVIFILIFLIKEDSQSVYL